MAACPVLAPPKREVDELEREKATHTEAPGKDGFGSTRRRFLRGGGGGVSSVGKRSFLQFSIWLITCRGSLWLNRIRMVLSAKGFFLFVFFFFLPATAQTWPSPNGGGQVSRYPTPGINYLGSPNRVGLKDFPEW
jgi:hypothetical protein